MFVFIKGHVRDIRAKRTEMFREPDPVSTDVDIFFYTILPSVIQTSIISHTVNSEYVSKKT